MATKIGVKRSSSPATIGVAKDCYAGANTPELDGLMAKLGGSSVAKEKTCSFCGATGHTGAEHVNVKEGASPSGEAITQDQATQYGYENNESKFTTGSKNYELPGMRGGKGTFIFG